jgi:hypothetical protein
VVFHDVMVFSRSHAARQTPLGCGAASGSIPPGRRRDAKFRAETTFCHGLARRRGQALDKYTRLEYMTDVTQRTARLSEICHEGRLGSDFTKRTQFRRPGQTFPLTPVRIYGI